MWPIYHYRPGEIFYASAINGKYDLIGLEYFGRAFVSVNASLIRNAMERFQSTKKYGPFINEVFHVILFADFYQRIDAIFGAHFSRHIMMIPPLAEYCVGEAYT